MPDARRPPPPQILPIPRATVLKSVRNAGAIAVGGALIYAVIPMRGDVGIVGAAFAILTILGLIPISIRRARAIAGSPAPVATAIEAITVLLVVLVFGFSSAYVVLADQGGQMSGLETKLDAVYFAITTLATVGYGDIHASGQLARAIVSMQMLFDLVFVAVAVRMMATIARRKIDLGSAMSGTDPDS